MKKAIGLLLLGLSVLTLSAQTTYFDDFASAPSGAPFPWGVQGAGGQGTGALWYANGRLEYSAAGGTAFPATDGAKRQLTLYMGSQSADWSMSVNFNLTASLSGNNIAALLLTAATPAGYLSVGNGTGASGNTFFWQDNVHNSQQPNYLATGAGLTSGSLRIDYTASNTTLTLYEGGTTFLYSQDVSSWFTGHPEYQMGLSLGASSFSSAAGNSPTIAGPNAYFDNFTASSSGAGLQSTAVPEPSTYAAIMGLAAVGVAAIRRRRKANTAAA